MRVPAVLREREERIMRYVLTDEQMKACDAYTIETMGVPSLVLMERAALSCVDALYEEGFDLARVLAVCGTGNNGADGVAVARLLHLKGVNVNVWLVGDPKKHSAELERQIRIAENYGVTFVHSPETGEYTTIVDALFGVGLRRSPAGEFADAVRRINESRARVLSVDIPSGVSGTTGAVPGPAVRADVTQTFAFEKRGLLLYPGAERAGKVRTADVGIYLPDKEKPGCMLTEDRDAAACFLRRPEWGNKGTFGKVLAVSGCDSMYGAAYLCASAALLTGAGMVKLHTARANADALRIALPEAMLSFREPEGTQEEEQLAALLPGEAWADLVLAGPGLGISAGSRQIVRHLLLSCEKPCVFDADALNIISEKPSLLKARRGLTVLTPHVGEMARLTGLRTEEIKEAPIECACEFAARYGVVCVLKDAHTVTALPDKTAYLTAAGNSGMATAGSGDVLAGVLAGLLAQKGASMRDAACAVHFHGVLGRVAARLHTRPAVTAGRLLEAVSGAMRELKID